MSAPLTLAILRFVAPPLPRTKAASSLAISTTFVSLPLLLPPPRLRERLRERDFERDLSSSDIFLLLRRESSSLSEPIVSGRLFLFRLLPGVRTLAAAACRCGSGLLRRACARRDFAGCPKSRRRAKQRPAAIIGCELALYQH
mmetsp:Transcript_27582/g.83511  ORF Transcript_27582/g.83511 Transcript_27582/m.83511 type:complete len:143 (+) Transcript_27582:1137-1565(+)